ncbi:MAG: META domain-containing protein [Helicobacter sp.]|nr:META domain-containing protein [Helicobacter sp.]
MSRFFTLFVPFVALFFAACASLNLNLFEAQLNSDNYKIQKIVVLDAQALIKANYILTDKDGLIDLSKVPNKFYKVYPGLALLQQSLRSALANAKTPQRRNQISDKINSLSALKPQANLYFNQQNGHVSGIISCNNFSSNYELKNADGINISNTAMTRKICPIPELNSLEVEFAKNFNGDFLIIPNGSGIVLKKPAIEIYLSE